MNTKGMVINLLLGISWIAVLIGLPRVSLAQGSVNYQICVALDGSGSIGSGAFNLQITGLAHAISDPAIAPQDGTVELGVVQFGMGDARVEVPATVIDSAATATAVAATIQSMGQVHGGTPMAIGIDLCTVQLTRSPHFSLAVKQVINVSTDGHPNDSMATMAARDAAVAAGIDELDVEAVGSGAGINFLTTLVYPQPAALIPPDAFSPGFVRIISSFADFEEAMREKLGAVIEPMPEVPVDLGPPLGTIRGMVFEDLNCNGARDLEESMLSGITFDLRSPGGVLVGGWTGDDGTYGPAGLTPCDYWIDLHVPPDYVATTPTTLGPLAVNGNAIIGQDFGLARPQWCLASNEEVADFPQFLPVTGSHTAAGSALMFMGGLLALTIGFRLGGVDGHSCVSWLPAVYHGGKHCTEAGASGQVQRLGIMALIRVPH